MDICISDLAVSLFPPWFELAKYSQGSRALSGILEGDKTYGQEKTLQGV